MSYTIDSEHFGMMPNQMHGDLNGKRYYFRARHGAWTLEVGDTNEDAVCGELVDEGGDENAGWWQPDEAKAFLTALLEKHSTKEKSDG